MNKRVRQRGSGRTINVPKTHPTNSVPGPSFNGAVTIGETCIGSHCAMPVEPTATNMINNNLNSANPPPGANVHYPGTDRLGNSSLSMPGINNYIGTQLNHGPHRIQCAGGKVKLPNGMCECECITSLKNNSCGSDGCVCMPGDDKKGLCNCGCADSNLDPKKNRFGEKANGKYNIKNKKGGSDFAPYFFIINPETGRKVNIHGKIGKKVIRNYLAVLN